MIEAVNSVVSNASLLRQSGQQASSFDNSAVDVESVTRFPLAPYVDRISVDTRFDTAVYEVRDSDTGDVLSQFPNETTLESRQRAESVRLRAEALRQRQSSGLSHDRSVSPSGSTQEASSAQTVAIAQSSAAFQSAQGAGQAQAAIAALSTGAQVGSPGAVSVSVTA